MENAVRQSSVHQENFKWQTKQMDYQQCQTQTAALRYLLRLPFQPLEQYEQWEWILRFYINDQKDKMSLEFLLLNSFEISW